MDFGSPDPFVTLHKFFPSLLLLLLQGARRLALSEVVRSIGTLNYAVLFQRGLLTPLN